MFNAKNSLLRFHSAVMTYLKFVYNQTYTIALHHCILSINCNSAIYSHKNNIPIMVQNSGHMIFSEIVPSHSYNW